MSGNSNSEGAWFDRPPQLTGYTAEWDGEAGTWVLTRKDNPERVIRGRNQTEVNAAHGRLIAEDSADLLALNHYAATHGMTPPPDDWIPPHRA